MKPNFLGKRLLFITAHPDDESFLAAGTMYKNFLAGGKSALICATYGEKGKARLGKSVTSRQLASMRKKELEKVSQFLHVANLFAFRLPDGNLTSKTMTLSAKIEKIIKKWKPDFIFSFGPDGVSGHMDHICIGEVSKKLSKKFSIQFLMFSATPTFIKEFELAQNRRSFGVYSSKIVHSGHSLKVTIDPKVKHKALSMHASQQIFEHLTKKTIHEILHYEYFR